MGYIGAGISRFNTVNGLSVNADGPTVTGIKDEDNMASDSAVKLATQQSIKAYVDSQIGANNELSEVLANGSTTGGNDISFGDADRAYFGAGNDLEIFSDGNTSYIKENGSGDLRIWADNPNIATAGGNKIFYGNNGVAELYYTGGVKRLETTSGGIDVTGTVTADGLTVGDGHQIGDETTYDNLVIKSSTNENMVLSAGGTGQFIYKTGSTTLDNGSEKMRLTNDGKLGLGNTSPAYGITLEGTGSKSSIRVGDTTNSVNVDIRADSTGGLIRTASNHPLVFATNQNEVARFDGSGNFGIGIASPLAKLHTYGADAHMRLDDTNGGVSFIGHDSTGAYWRTFTTDTHRFVRASGAESMRIDSSGRVGINRTSPFRNLHVVDSSTEVPARFQGGANGVSVEFVDNTTSTVPAIGVTGNDLLIKLGASEAARMNSSGTFIVGKTSTSRGQTGAFMQANGLMSATSDNAVTLELNRETSDGNIIQVYKDNGLVGSVGANGGYPYIANTVNVGARFTGSDIRPSTSTGADRDNAIDLGDGGSRFKDLYLSGKAYISDGGAGAPAYTFGNDTDTGIFRPTGNQIGLTTGGNERMRIDSAGQMFLNCTADQVTSYERISVNGSGGFKSGDTSVLALWQTNTSGNMMQFFGGSAGNLVGSISITGSGTTYNTTSDIRLKTDIAPIADATDKLMAMNAVTHKWKSDPDADAVVGFIAQEMAEIVPEAVSGDPDSEEMMAMDYGRITPVIVAALQEANKKIAELETRIKELETK